MKKTNKTFKRFAAITSASLLAACAVAPAVSYAATLETGGKTITIDSGEYTHTAIKAYEIFSGEATEKGLNITGWGNGIDYASFFVDIKTDSTLESYFANVKVGPEEEVDNPIAANVADAKVAVAIANVIDTFADESPEAELIAKYAVKNKATPSGTYNSTNKNITGVSVGYYIVVDESGVDVNESEAITETAYSLGMLKVVDNSSEIKVNTKMGYPTFTKEINDINDCETTYQYDDEVENKYVSGGEWGTDADHDIGDDVPFKLTATLPANIDDYATYKLVFHDDLEAGVFTLNTDSFNMYWVDSTTKTKTPITGISPVTSGLSTDSNFNNNKTDGTKDFTITFDNVKSITGIGAGDEIVIEYTAELNTNADIGVDGNWNSAYLEYSNNPNYVGDGANMPTGNTPEQTVVAFTYQTEIIKTNGITDEYLPGAAFKLYKAKSEDSVASDLSGWIEDDTTYTANTTDYTFTFTGLDDGKYMLVESEVPDEFNGIDPIVFEITGVHEGKALVSLNSVTSESETTTINLTNTQTGSVDLTNGKISATIENLKGSSLPGTGGIGTTIFYLGGGAMAAIGGVYLISKRRMKKSEE